MGRTGFGRRNEGTDLVGGEVRRRRGVGR